MGHSIPSLRMLHWIPADATEIAPDTPLLDEQYELLPPLSHQLMIHRLNIDLWNELAQTVQSMNPVESIPFLLESEGESKTYFSILIPVGPEGAETPSVLLATLSLDALSDYAMRKLQAGGVHIRIAEVGKGGSDQTLHWHSSRAEPRPLKSFESSRSLLLARGYQFQTNVTSVARNWRFECYPAKILIDQYRTHQGWGALGMGALAT